MISDIINMAKPILLKLGTDAITSMISKKDEAPIILTQPKPIRSYPSPDSHAIQPNQVTINVNIYIQGGSDQKNIYDQTFEF